MIDKAVEIIKDEIGSYIVRLPELEISTEKKIHATPIVKFDGTMAISNDSLGLSLVNVEEERVMKSSKMVTVDSSGHVSHVNPELRLNLYLLIAANFANYDTCLKFLSAAIRFFQSKSVFTHKNTPDLNPAINKLVAELHTLSFEQQNHLWGALGAKYVPSVMYKVRLVSIQEAHKTDEQPPIERTSFAGKGF